MFAKSREEKLTPEALVCGKGCGCGRGDNSADEPPEIKV